MTRDVRLLLSRAAATAALAVILPAVAMAQVAARAVEDTPSKSRETKLQHDSLAVHFLRTPKAKPSARAVAGTRGELSAKFRGRPEPVAATEPVATPLPTRKGKPKQ